MASRYPEEHDSEADWETDSSIESNSFSETESNGGKLYPSTKIDCLYEIFLIIYPCTSLAAVTNF